MIDGILHDPPDYVGSEFSLGGRLVKEMDAATFDKLKARGVTLCFNSAHRVEDHFVDVTEMVDIGGGTQRAVSALDDLLSCERRCALLGDEDHFVEVTEMIEIGRDSVWCESCWCLTGDEAVWGERDLFQFTEKRRVEELEKTGEAEQWVRASFGGEGDGGSPFEGRKGVKVKVSRCQCVSDGLNFDQELIQKAFLNSF